MKIFYIFWVDSLKTEKKKKDHIVSFFKGSFGERKEGIRAMSGITQTVKSGSAGNEHCKSQWR